MTRKPRALTRQFERLIETALTPGRFVSYNASFSFVRDLEAAEQRLAKGLSMDPAQAVAFYETFLAGCYEKAEEIDDSSGCFGDFVGKLHCSVAAMRRAMPPGLSTAQHPSTYAYDDLMKYVPKAERAAWREKAVEAAKGSDLDSLIELLLKTKELERLASLVRGSPDEALENVSHYVTEPAAKKLEKSHPDVAARLWCAQGLRIVNAKKSKYYDAALSNFERARRCFEKADLVGEWQRMVEKVRSQDQRKTGFISGFEEIVAGSGPSQRPSFLQRAKARWAPGGRKA